MILVHIFNSIPLDDCLSYEKHSFDFLCAVEQIVSDFDVVVFGINDSFYIVANDDDLSGIADILMENYMDCNNFTDFNIYSSMGMDDIDDIFTKDILSFDDFVIIPSDFYSLQNVS